MSAGGETLRRLLPLRPGEALPTLQAAAYAFCILFAYYLLRPVRDEIAAADRGNLQWLWTAVFLVMLAATPLYAAAVARWPRRVFVPAANRFFALHLIAFHAALVFLPESARPWIDRVFYVWLSVFALFVVSVLWGLLVDLFSAEQGRRLFGLITVGASLGALAGSSASALLATALPVFLLLPLAMLPLEAGSRLAQALDRQAERTPTRLGRDPVAPIGGGTLAGILATVHNPRLRAIAGWIALMTLASTVLYFTQAQLLGEALADRALRREFLARVDIAVNALTIATQAFATAAVVRRLGVGATLAILPAIAASGFLVLGGMALALSSAGGILLALASLRVLYDGSRHALAKPAREVLFTGVDREARYKAKTFIDTAVYRGGDLASGWLYAGALALGLGAGGIALLAVLPAIVWYRLSLRLGVPPASS